MARILVIDSEVSTRMSLRSILSTAGYDVELSGDLAEGGLIHTKEPVDLVLSDTVPSDSRDQFVGARLLAVLSGNASAPNAANVLLKPFRRDDLLTAVQSALGAA